MAKIAQLVAGDYNVLDNIPVINQDLSASGFTPVANTYYRHTGATTDTFTQGVIYLYDTAYHKLGESGGGTTLNRYELSIDTSQLSSNTALLYKIYTQAKGRITACQYNYSSRYSYNYKEFALYEIFYQESVNTVSRVKFYNVRGDQPSVTATGYSSTRQGTTYDYATISNDKTITYANNSAWTGTLKIIYYNDTEIT